MSANPTNPDQLPERAERLLEQWPDRLLSEADFERMARTIEAQVHTAQMHAAQVSSPELDPSEPDWLLRPPLPLQQGEPRQRIAALDGERRDAANASVLDDDQSLKAIARAALDATQRVNEAVVGAEHAPPARPRALPRVLPRAVPRAPVALLSPAPPSPELLSPAPPASSESDVRDRISAVRLVRTETSPSPERSRRRSWVWPFGAFAAAASILGLFTFGAETDRSESDGARASSAAEDSTRTEDTLERSEAPSIAAAPILRGTEAEPAIQPTETQPAETPSATEVNRLPREARTATPARPSKPLAVAAPSADEAPSAPGSAHLQSGAHAPGAHAQSGANAPPALESSPPEAEPQLVPAARETSQTERPSIGAAQVALGSVSGAARACLAGHFTPSKATVVFGSDGRVREVQITGPAAGTPAESCIVTAMSQARVKPFSDESFLIRTTVRP